MATLFYRHMVADYAAWRKVYDEFDAVRPSFGVTSHGVYQSDENPNDITGYHEFNSMDAAKAFANSNELKEAMGKAGVVGAPDIWFTNRV
jgi:hypothetical protein